MLPRVKNGCKVRIRLVALGDSFTFDLFNAGPKSVHSGVVALGADSSFWHGFHRKCKYDVKLGRQFC